MLACRMDRDIAWRLARCLTVGPKIRILLSGNSTSSTAIVLFAGAGCTSVTTATAAFIRWRGRWNSSVNSTIALKDNLDLERWFRLPKSHERRIHGHRH